MRTICSMVIVEGLTNAAAFLLLQLFCAGQGSREIKCQRLWFQTKRLRGNGTNLR